MNKFIKVLRSLFIRNINSHTINDLNPWAGLMSYADPADGGPEYKFCGRDREIIDLFYLVDNNFVVTLYGKSGIGKTSLLNAGLFPRLRADGYHPITIRLGVVKDEDLVGYVIRCINNEMESQYGADSIKRRNIDTIQSNMPDSRIWFYFASHRFYNNEGKVIFPVVVFDQFEEVLRSNNEGALALLREISFISDKHNAIEDGYIDDKPYTYDFNFRFVLSIREDELYRLDDIVDSDFIARIKDCRYRLRNLTEGGASSVVGDIGRPYIKQDELDRVVKLIIDASREEGLINTNLLSLLCYRMYERYTATKAPTITAVMAEKFISANPVEDYYEEAVKDLSEREKRFIESRMIDSYGCRNSVSDKEFVANMRNPAHLFDGRNRIMHRVSAGTGSKSTNVELLHDAICPAILRKRNERLEQKTNTIAGLTLIILGCVAYYFLSESIIDGFVNFFIKIQSKITFEGVESVVLFVTLLFLPIMTGLIVRSYRLPLKVAVLPAVLAIAPVILFGYSDFSTPIGIATIVFSSIALLMIWPLSHAADKSLSLGKAIKEVYGMLPVKLFYLVLCCYLYYKSIYNPAFICESYDSLWGIVVIPFLAVDLTIAYLKIPYKSRWICVYVSLLVLTGVCTVIFNFNARIYIEAIGVVLSCIVIWKTLAGSGRISHIAFTILNFLLLSAVLIANLGYKPGVLYKQEVVRVYPWQLAIVNQNGMYGSADVETGKTIVDAQFDSISGRYLIRDLDTLRVTSSRLMLENGPWFLVENNGKWQIWMLLHANFENNLCQLLKYDSAKILSDSIKVEAASTFIKLRNATATYVINGNDSLLRTMPNQLMNLSSKLQQNLDERLQVLSSNYKRIDESIVNAMIEALTRCLYINMIREALLKERYNIVCEWFLHYYQSILLTDFMPSSYIIKFSSLIENNFLLNGKKFNEPSFTSDFSLKDLSEHRAAVWYDMFYLLFAHECVSDYNTYLIAMQTNSKVLDTMAAQFKAYKQTFKTQVQSLQGDLDKAKNIQNIYTQIIADLMHAVSNSDTLKAEDLARILETLRVTEPNSRRIQNNAENSLADVALFSTEMDSVLSTAKNIALEQVDVDFEKLICSTFINLLDIVKVNPNNMYKGLFITICERLYTMGAFRLYDMNEYKKDMDEISSQRVSGMYRLVVETDSLVKEQDKSLNRYKEQMNQYMSDIQKLHKLYDAVK